MMGLFPIVLLLLTIYSLPQSNNSGLIELKVEGLRNTDGNILASLFQSSEGFPGEHGKALVYKEVKIEGNVMTLRFENLPYGTYAVALIHDENSNQKLDTNFFGIPNEGFGTTNNTRPKFRAPNFNEASVDLENTELKTTIVLHYY